MNNLYKEILQTLDNNSVDDCGGHLCVFHDGANEYEVIEEIKKVYKDEYNYDLKDNYMEDVEIDEFTFSCFLGMVFFPINGKNKILDQLDYSFNDEEFDELIECEEVDLLFDLCATFKNIEKLDYEEISSLQRFMSDYS